MLFRPLLAEAASATIEPRHVVVPLRTDVPAGGADRRSRDGARRGGAHGDGRGSTSARLPFATSAWCSRSGRSRARCRSQASPSTRSASTTSPTRSRCATTSSASSRPLTPSSTRNAPAATSASSSSARATRASRRSPSSRTSSATRSRHYPRLPAVPQRWVLVEAGDRILHELPRAPRHVRRPAARAPGCRDQDAHAARAARRRVGDALGRRADRHAHARLDRGRRAEPAARGVGPAGRRGGPGRGGRAAARRRTRRRLGARRLRARPERGDRRARPADEPARPPAGAPAREEPRRRRRARTRTG